jgi:hypothetical protein
MQELKHRSKPICVKEVTVVDLVKMHDPEASIHDDILHFVSIYHFLPQL